MKRTQLGPGRKSLERGSTFASRGNGLKRGATKPRRKAWRASSKPWWTPAIAAKLERERSEDGTIYCRNCPAPAADPHHAVPRGLSKLGRSDERNIIPLCRPCHDYFTEGGPLPRSVLTDEEAAFAEEIAPSIGWLGRRYPRSLPQPKERL